MTLLTEVRSEPVPAGLVEGWLWSALAVVFFGFGLFTQLTMPMTDDTAWHLISASALLDGARLYVSTFVDVNLPLPVVITVPAVFVARLLGLDAMPAFVLFVFLLIALSTGLLWSILRIDPAPPPRLCHGLLLAAVFVLTISPARDFTQREHIMLVLALPYMALVARRTEGLKAGSGLVLLVGALAGFGFAIKPHYLVIPAVLELYLLLRGRRLTGVFRPDTVGLAAAVAVIAAAILWLTPEYLEEMVPIALAVYEQGHQLTLGDMIWRAEPAMLIILVGLHVLTRGRQTHPAYIDVFVVAAICFCTLFVLQMKGWSYQAYPAVGSMILAAAVLIAGGAFSAGAEEKAPRTASPGRRKLHSALVILLVVAGLAAVRGHYRSPHVESLAPVVRHHGAGQTISAITSHLWVSFPLVNVTETRWTSRFPSLWPLPGLQQARLDPELSTEQARRLDEIEDYVRNAVIEDLEQGQPVLLLVDVRPEKPEYGPQGFDFLAFFSSDPRFAALFSRYRKVDQVGHLAIYKRDGA